MSIYAVIFSKILLRYVIRDLEKEVLSLSEVQKEGSEKVYLP